MSNVQQLLLLLTCSERQPQTGDRSLARCAASIAIATDFVRRSAFSGAVKRLLQRRCQSVCLSCPGHYCI